MKVCCIQDEAEAELAASAGATHLGLVGAMPSGPGPISDDHIAGIVRGLPPGVTSVLLTSRTNASDIVEHVTSTSAALVQIVSRVPVAVRGQIRRSLSSVRIMQVVHVSGPASLPEASEAAQNSDYVLLDSGRPGAAVPELGGTGRTHDWSVSAEIVAHLSVPVFLAGGLNPTNVADAVAAVRPAGVDVCTGVRDDSGRLDAGLLRRFISAALG